MIDFPPDLLSSFIHEVVTRTGIVIRDRDRSSFAKKLSERVNAQHQPNLQAYYHWLFAKPNEIRDQTTARGQEWQRIIQRISITESYFFRDRGQFQLLREQILPRLIDERRKRAKASGKRPCLRLWSAASSTGEEPYSLAILVWELLTDLSDWDVRIIGTDINEAALVIARKALYSDWSFRQVDPVIRDRYFKLGAHLTDRSWKLDPRIAQLVTFVPLNLSQPDFPNSNLDLVDVDLILCRNVFIYLDAITIQGILKRMAHTLNRQGYLLTAHAELQHQYTGVFKAQLCPQSLVYQRQDSDSALLAESTASPLPHPLPNVVPAQHSSPSARDAVIPPFLNPPAIPPTQRSPHLAPPVVSPQAPILPPPLAPPIIPPVVTARTTPPQSPKLPQPQTSHLNSSHPPRHASMESQPSMEQAIALFHRKDYPATIDVLDRLLSQAPQHFPACDLLSLAYANLGQYNQASYYCSKALEIDACATSPYYLMAHLAENSGDISRAKTLLKRIIYLDPEAALAYLELAALYRTEGDAPRAAKMERTARILLDAHDADEILDPYRRLSVGLVRQQIEQPDDSSRSL